MKRLRDHLDGSQQMSNNTKINKTQILAILKINMDSIRKTIQSNKNPKKASKTMRTTQTKNNSQVISLLDLTRWRKELSPTTYREGVTKIIL